jgi:GWxTD domain-containing protein
MKKLFVFIFCIASVVFNSLANSKVTAYLTFASFNVPAKTPYIETYLSIIGNSVKFIKNNDGKFQGAVDISISFTQNGEFKTGQKYTLNSPTTSDTSLGSPNFIDQQRFSLSNGSYVMEVSISDKNNPAEKPFSTQVPITINFTEDRVLLSDFQLLESYTKSSQPSIITKSGYDLIPYVSTFYPENIQKLKFYSEIYNSKKIIGNEQKMVINYFIETYEKRTKLNDYTAFSKQNTNDVNILLAELDISKLPSGNYNLVVEVRDKENKIQAEQKLFFQRQNSKGLLSYTDLKSVEVKNTFVTAYTNVDTLSEYIRCIRPISGFSEVQYAQNQLKEKNLESMQQFFYNFWHSRNEKEPQLTWLEYYKEVMKVNKEFTTYGLKGYDTDRGRVYLQYGAPDQRSKVDVEPSAYPYEIWEYSRLVDKALLTTYPDNKQSNKKFVFYNPDLVTNKYTLIHSTAQGETYNTRWEMLIHKRDTQSNDYDVENAPTHFGGNANDNFRNTR